ncbi:MAG: hypothetical protein P4L10_09070 [Acidobacteriaceae bacterium]|nr:hypothetical protein [Acidobacteriaceae bacterium]
MRYSTFVLPRHLGISFLFALFLTMTCVSANAQAIAQVTVDPNAAALTSAIPSDFVGLSLRQGDVQTVIGSMPVYGGPITMNTKFQTLIDNLGGLGGTAMTLRMLGDGPGPNTLHNALPVLAKLNASKSHKYFIGIDFQNGMNPYNGVSGQTIVAEEVGDITSGVLDPSSIEALELGNEPDNYPGETNSKYWADELTYWDALGPIPQGLKFAAPVFAGNNTSFDEAGFVTTRHNQISMFDFHYYGGSNCQTTPPARNSLLLQASIAPPASAYQHNNPADPYLSNAITAAKSASPVLPIRAGEINTIACHGAFGLSDTFTSAVWTLDMGMTYALAGVNGINFFLATDQTYHKAESGSNAYNAFDFNSSGGLAYVAPEYYAMVLLEHMVANNAVIIPATIANNGLGYTAAWPKFKAWATRDTNGKVHVLLINKDDGSNGLPTDGTVTLALPGRGLVTVYRITSTGGVYNGWWDPNTGTIKPNGVTGMVMNNNQTYDNSTDGNPLTLTNPIGPVPEAVSPVNGVYTLKVPVGNAVVLVVPAP